MQNTCMIAHTNQRTLLTFTQTKKHAKQTSFKAFLQVAVNRAVEEMLSKKEDHFHIKA